MSRIEQYNEAKKRLGMFRAWAGLVGKPYHGGGGGVGSVASCSVNITIYHQYSNGDRNYHDQEPFMEPALHAAAKELAPQIITRAQEFLQAGVDAAATAAEEEARGVLAAISKEAPQ